MLGLRPSHNPSLTEKKEHIRRFYEIGDTVKVIISWNIGREGWVLAIKDDEVDVFDRISNEEV